MLVLGKGLSGGYYPMAAVLLADHMVTTMTTGSGVAPFGHTFSGNPLGAATCLAVLDVLEEADALHNVQQRGQQLQTGLREIAEHSPYMSDVRGRGLLWGFEFVTDRETKAPPARQRDTANVFVEECFNRSLIIYPAGIAPLNNAAMISPPLTIAEDEIDELLTHLGEAVQAMDQHIARWSRVDPPNPPSPAWPA